MILQINTINEVWELKRALCNIRKEKCLEIKRIDQYKLNLTDKDAIEAVTKTSNILKADVRTETNLIKQLAIEIDNYYKNKENEQ